MAVQHVPHLPLTYRDLVRLRKQATDTCRREIIDGELYVTPSPSVSHQRVVGRLFRWLSGHVELHGLGEVFVAPLDVIFSKHSVVQPDIIYLTLDQVARIPRRGVAEPPTLVIEVLSPGTSRYDRGQKRALYERMGVLHLWFVDPVGRNLEAHALRAGRYELVAAVAGDAEFQPALFPGLVLRLGALWASPGGASQTTGSG